MKDFAYLENKLPSLVGNSGCNVSRKASLTSLLHGIAFPTVDATKQSDKPYSME
jgi:hypothetical protein